MLFGGQVKAAKLVVISAQNKRQTIILPLTRLYQLNFAAFC